MLIVEFLKTVGQLAEAITHKNAELERLKIEYEKKLALLNSYIGIYASNQDGQELDDTKLIDLISQDFKCPNCEHKLYSLMKDSDFVLIPKKKIKTPQTGSPGLSDQLRQLSLDAQKLSSTTLDQKENQPIQEKQKRHHGGKQKRTCSYCKESGHSRAKCFKRLTKDTSH